MISPTLNFFFSKILLDLFHSYVIRPTELDSFKEKFVLNCIKILTSKDSFITYVFGRRKIFAFSKKHFTRALKALLKFIF